MCSENIVDIDRMIRRRLEKFHDTCAQKCNSKKSFDNGFLVNKSHIAKGMIKNPKRSALNNEDIAAVIKHGDLHYEGCKDSNPIEIVVKGIIKDYELSDLSDIGKIITHKEERVEVKVVIREKYPKNHIVTAYVTDNENDISTNKEIDREIW